MCYPSVFTGRSRATFISPVIDSYLPAQSVGFLPLLSPPLKHLNVFQTPPWQYFGLDQRGGFQVLIFSITVCVSGEVFTVDSHISPCGLLCLSSHQLSITVYILAGQGTCRELYPFFYPLQHPGPIPAQPTFPHPDRVSLN